MFVDPVPYAWVEIRGDHRKLRFGWGQNKAKNRLHALADEHLDPRKLFTSQDPLALRKVLKLINAEFPILKDYEQNWAANRILQAHLKVTAAAATKTSSRRVVQAVASVMNGPGAPATARRRSAN
ncbi:hypothetical protein B0H10DRAFT_1955742 [Mycena sp. CBHHK59/15]|nr:hypothetical protein B0H10DRAFT_1955742 [Mycena sp. CBHHK59/15]